jgi:hypothetical protein
MALSTPTAPTGLPITVLPRGLGGTNQVQVSADGVTLINKGNCLIYVSTTSEFQNGTVIDLETGESLPWQQNACFVSVDEGNSGTLLVQQGVLNYYNPNVVLTASPSSLEAEYTFLRTTPTSVDISILASTAAIIVNARAESNTIIFTGDQSGYQYTPLICITGEPAICPIIPNLDTSITATIQQPITATGKFQCFISQVTDATAWVQAQRDHRANSLRSIGGQLTAAGTLALLTGTVTASQYSGFRIFKLSIASNNAAFGLFNDVLTGNPILQGTNVVMDFGDNPYYLGGAFGVESATLQGQVLDAIAGANKVAFTALYDSYTVAV